MSSRSVFARGKIRKNVVDEQLEERRALNQRNKTDVKSVIDEESIATLASESVGTARTSTPDEDCSTMAPPTPTETVSQPAPQPQPKPPRVPFAVQPLTEAGITPHSLTQVEDQTPPTPLCAFFSVPNYTELWEAHPSLLYQPVINQRPQYAPPHQTVQHHSPPPVQRKPPKPAPPKKKSETKKGVLYYYQQQQAQAKANKERKKKPLKQKTDAQLTQEATALKYISAEMYDPHPYHPGHPQQPHPPEPPMHNLHQPPRHLHSPDTLYSLNTDSTTASTEGGSVYGDLTQAGVGTLNRELQHMLQLEAALIQQADMLDEKIQPPPKPPIPTIPESRQAALEALLQEGNTILHRQMSDEPEALCSPDVYEARLGSQDANQQDCYQEQQTSGIQEEKLFVKKSGKLGKASKAKTSNIVCTTSDTNSQLPQGQVDSCTAVVSGLYNNTDPVTGKTNSKPNNNCQCLHAQEGARINAYNLPQRYNSAEMEQLHNPSHVHTSPVNTNTHTRPLLMDNKQPHCVNTHHGNTNSSIRKNNTGTVTRARSLSPITTTKALPCCPAVPTRSVSPPLDLNTTTFSVSKAPPVPPKPKSASTHDLPPVRGGRHKLGPQQRNPRALTAPEQTDCQSSSFATASYFISPRKRNKVQRRKMPMWAFGLDLEDEQFQSSQKEVDPLIKWAQELDFDCFLEDLWEAEDEALGASMASVTQSCNWPFGNT